VRQASDPRGDSHTQDSGARRWAAAPVADPFFAAGQAAHVTKAPLHGWPAAPWLAAASAAGPPIWARISLLGTSLLPIVKDTQPDSQS